MPSSGAQASTKLRNYAVRQKLCIESARGYWAKKRLAHQLPGGEHGGIAPFPQQVLNPSLSLSIEEGFEVCPQGSPITRPSEVVRGELPLLVTPKSNAGARELGELGPYSASGRIPPDEEGASSIHSAESSEDL